MAETASEIKLFGKLSYEDVEVRCANASVARMSTLTRGRFIYGLVFCGVGPGIDRTRGLPVARTNVQGLEGRGHRVEGSRVGLSRPDPASGPSKSRHRGRHSGRSASETRDGFSRVVGRGVTKRAVAKRLEWMRPSLVAASPYS